MKNTYLGREGLFNDSKPTLREEEAKSLPNNLVNSKLVKTEYEMFSNWFKNNCKPYFNTFEIKLNKFKIIEYNNDGIYHFIPLSPNGLKYGYFNKDGFRLTPWNRYSDIKNIDENNKQNEEYKVVSDWYKINITDRISYI